MSGIDLSRSKRRLIRYPEAVADFSIVSERRSNRHVNTYGDPAHKSRVVRQMDYVQSSPNTPGGFWHLLQDAFGVKRRRKCGRLYLGIRVIYWHIVVFVGDGFLCNAYIYIHIMMRVSNRNLPHSAQDISVHLFKVSLPVATGIDRVKNGETAADRWRSWIERSRWFLV